MTGAGVEGLEAEVVAKATWTQALPDWIPRSRARLRGDWRRSRARRAGQRQDRHRQALLLRTRGQSHLRRDGDALRTAILPARPRRPRDKAKVEQTVLIVERWVLGRFRRRIFHSLADVDAALGELMTQLNERQPLSRLCTPPAAGCSRRSIARR